MMRMTRTALLAAAGLGVLGAAGAATAQQAQPAQPQQRSAKDYKLTKEVRNLVAEAQQLNAAASYPAAVAKLDQALPLSKTTDDKFIISQLLIEVGGKSNDVPLQQRGLQLALDSGSLSAPEQAKYRFFQGRYLYSTGKYAEALPVLKAAQAAGHQDPQLALLIADASFKANDSAGGIATLRQAVDAEIAAGRKPDQNWLKRGLAAAYQAKQADQIAWWSMQTVKAYPTPENWRTSLVIFRDGANLDPQAQLDLMRLMRATKSMAGERDFYEYADAAYDRGLPGEVKAVIDEGRASNAIGKPSAPLNELYTLASPKVTADRASLPASEKAAATARDGKVAATTGDALLSYGEYARAAAMYQLAMQKGGQDANTVNTRLGIALAMSGQAPAAKEAFAKVTGPRKPVADYWTLFVDQRA